MRTLLLISFVAAFASQSKEGQMVVLTAEQDGKRVEVSRSATLTIKLPAQLGTGFSWKVAESDAAILSPVGEPRIETSEKPGVGRQDLQVFAFTPIKTGTTTLKLHYMRPWEKDVKPRKVYAVTIKVE